MLLARAPDWEPTLLLERSAAERELWFPSLHGARVAFSEVVYSPDRTTDQRHVYLLDLGAPESEPVRLDHSDLATMPVLVEDTVIWKEADPGFSMFNWGLLWRHDLGGPGPMRLDTAPVDYVDTPSAGSRFVAWSAADSFQFVVYDLLENRPRVIEQLHRRTSRPTCSARTSPGTCSSGSMPRARRPMATPRSGTRSCRPSGRCPRSLTGASCA